VRLTPRAVEIFLKRERIAAHLRAAETIDNGPGPRTQSPLCLLRQPVRGARQELPAAVLFLPDLHDANLGICDLALQLGLPDPKMPDDRGVADHLHRHFGKLKRLDGRLPPHDPLYELCLVLEPGVGMAVAQLWQSYRLELTPT